MTTLLRLSPTLPLAAPRTFNLSSAMPHLAPSPLSYNKFTPLSGKAFVLLSTSFSSPDRRILNWTCSASNNKQLCVTQTLTSIQSNTGTLTIDKFRQVILAIADGQTSSLNGTNLCTPCVKQIYNVAKGDFPAIFGQGTTIASDVQADCGASFVGESKISVEGFRAPPRSLRLIDLS